MIIIKSNEKEIITDLRTKYSCYTAIRKKKSGLISAVIFERKSDSDFLLDNMILLESESTEA